jgi:hypothetical protein
MLRYKVSASIGVRGAGRIVAGTAMCAVLLFAAASAQAEPPPKRSGVTCANNDISGAVVPNNVTVPPGGKCAFIDKSLTQPTTVDGNVTVGQGAVLYAFFSVIKGNISTEGAAQVNLIGSLLEGNVSIDSTSGTEGTLFCGLFAVCLLDSGFGGNLSVTNTSPLAAEISENFIVRDLTCNGNASVTNGGFTNTVLGQEFGQCAGL